MLDLPEMKTIEPSNTCWLAHKLCVKAVTESYSAIENSRNNIYEQTHEPEALGFSRVFCKIYLLDYALSQFVKLSKSLQAEKFHLTITSLVDATLNRLDDAILPVNHRMHHFLPKATD